jgi:hypothetical protein
VSVTGEPLQTGDPVVDEALHLLREALTDDSPDRQAEAFDETQAVLQDRLADLEQ